MSSRGFSLIEVMVASSISLIIITAAASSLSMGMRFVGERRLRNTADTIAQAHLETLLALAQDRTLTNDDCANVTYNGAAFGEAAGPFVASCTLALGRPIPSAMRIDLTVSTTYDSRRLNSRFSTYVVR